jgi:hypothetical protein
VHATESHSSQGLSNAKASARSCEFAAEPSYPLGGGNQNTQQQCCGSPKTNSMLSQEIQNELARKSQAEPNVWHWEPVTIRQTVARRKRKPPSPRDITGLGRRGLRSNRTPKIGPRAQSRAALGAAQLVSTPSARTAPVSAFSSAKWPIVSQRISVRGPNPTAVSSSAQLLTQPSAHSTVQPTPQCPAYHTQCPAYHTHARKRPNKARTGTARHEHAWSIEHPRAAPTCCTHVQLSRLCSTRTVSVLYHETQWKEH